MKIFGYEIIEQKALSEIFESHDKQVSRLVGQNTHYEIEINDLYKQIESLKKDIADKDTRLNQLHAKFIIEIDNSKRLIEDLKSLAGTISDLTNKFK